MDPPEAVRDTLAAHGGEKVWKRIKALEAEISVSDLLFKFKRRPILLADKPLPGPILVALDIHHVQPV